MKELKVISDSRIKKVIDALELRQIVFIEGKASVTISQEKFMSLCERINIKLGKKIIRTYKLGYDEPETNIDTSLFIKFFCINELTVMKDIVSFLLLLENAFKAADNIIKFNL